MRAIVNQGILPLYGEDERCFIIEDEVLYGMPVEIIEDNLGGERVRIRTSYNYTGYVTKQGLYIKSPVIAYGYEQDLIVINHSTVDIMTYPTVKSEILMTLPLGCRLVKEQGISELGWIGVRLVDGRIGYIKEQYTTSFIANAIENEEAFRRALVKTAKRYLGTPYRWGGKTPLGIDCSGLCSMVYLLNGVKIFRDAKIHPDFPIHEIPLEKLKRGDLLYFKGHMAMWLGNHRIIHSTAKIGREGVVIDNIDKSEPRGRAELWSIFIGAGSLF